MPILVDFSGTVHAGVHVDVRNHADSSKEFLRHIIINQLRAIRKKFWSKYGEMIICMDAHDGYWRKEIFPYYKAKRKEAREASTIDWGTVFGYVNEITEEIKENLPYKIVTVSHAEADDVIGTLAQKQPWGKDTFFGDEEKCLIVSNDHDFKQLHGISGIVQYFPFSGKLERVNHPDIYRIEHILKGDTGDGIPNVRSPRDIFMQSGVRQKPVSKKYIESFIHTGVCPEEDQERFQENKKLIDLREIPAEIQNRIVTAYEEAPCGNRFKLFPYLASTGLKTQLEHISDF